MLVKSWDKWPHERILLILFYKVNNVQKTSYISAAKTNAGNLYDSKTVKIV